MPWLWPWKGRPLRCSASMTNAGTVSKEDTKFLSIRDASSQGLSPEKTGPAFGMDSGKDSITKATWARRRTLLCRIWFEYTGSEEPWIGTLTQSLQSSNWPVGEARIQMCQNGLTSYFNAIRELAETGIVEYSQAKASEEVRSILSILAIQKGARAHAKFLVKYSEEELLDFESQM
jgi:hypothetical protein